MTHLSLKQFLWDELLSKMSQAPTEAVSRTSLCSGMSHLAGVGDSKAKIPCVYPECKGCFWEWCTQVSACLLPLYSHQPIAICIATFSNLRPSSPHCLGTLLCATLICLLLFSLAPRAKLNTTYCNYLSFLYKNRPRTILNINHCIIPQHTHRG